MKKLFGILMLLIATGFIQNVNAQQDVKEGGNSEQILTPDAFATKWTEVLRSKLQLTDEQYTKVNAMDYDLFGTLSADYISYKDQTDDLMEKKTVALDKTIEKIRAILTAHQLPLLADTRKELDVALAGKKQNISHPAKTSRQ